MAVLRVAAAALLFFPTASAGSCGDRSIKIGGLRNVLLSGTCGEVSPGGGAVKLSHNEFANVVSTCEAPDDDPEHITPFRLLGATFSFVVDLSRVGCACNLAVYLVSAPARGQDGKPFKGRGDYYCDANMVGGQWCPDIDLMEANNHAFQATPHKCDAPVGDRHYMYCDRGGCAQSSRDQPRAYGVGQEYAIDTRRPFTVSTTFEEDHAGFSGFRTLLAQEGRQVMLNHEGCSKDYLRQLTGALSDGMSLVFSYWGDSAQTMAWMDSPPCGPQACQGGEGGAAIVSQMRITKAIAAPSHAPPPAPPPAAWRAAGPTTTTTINAALLATRPRSGPIQWRRHPEKCLTVDGHAAGARLVSSECLAGDARQAFVSRGDGLIRWQQRPELCVSVHGGENRNGALVLLADCGAGGGDLAWSYPWSDGTIRWRSHPERCVDVSDRSTWNWVAIQVWDCIGAGSDQAFDWPEASAAPAAPTTAAPTTPAPESSSSSSATLLATSTSTSPPPTPAPSSTAPPTSPPMLSTAASTAAPSTAPPSTASGSSALASTASRSTAPPSTASASTAPPSAAPPSTAPPSTASASTASASTAPSWTAPPSTTAQSWGPPAWGAPVRPSTSAPASLPTSSKREATTTAAAAASTSLESPFATLAPESTTTWNAPVSSAPSSSSRVVPSTPAATVSTSSRSPVATAAPMPPLYNCGGAAAAAWGASQREWCCAYQGVGCGVATTAAPHYNCDWGYPDFTSAWSPERRTWCCKHANKTLACGAPSQPDIVYATEGPEADWYATDDRGGSAERTAQADGWFVSGPGSTTTAAPSSELGQWLPQRLPQGQRPEEGCEHAETYDCYENLGVWHMAWAPDQMRVCCRCHLTGCDPGVLAVPDRFDCSDFSRDYQNSWTREKRDFCCSHGCPHLGAPVAPQGKAASLRLPSRCWPLARRLGSVGIGVGLAAAVVGLAARGLRGRGAQRGDEARSLLGETPLTWAEALGPPARRVQLPRA